MESLVVKALAASRSVESSGSEACSSEPDAFHVKDLVVELELDEVLRTQDQHDPEIVAEKWKNLVLEITGHMSRSTSVVIRGWTPQLNLEFSKASIQMQFGGDLGFDCMWVDGLCLASNRDLKETDRQGYHKTTTMAQFIEQAQDTSVCGNFLDGKDMNQTPPIWAKAIFDSSTAWERTAHLKWAKKAGESEPALFERSAPTVIRSETWTSQGWKLATHAGYLTLPHFDCCGMGTYIIGDAGGKMWATLRPRRKSCPTQLKELQQRLSEATDISKEAKFTMADVATVCLEAGDVM